MKNNRIVIIGSTVKSILNFRSSLITELKKRGFDVFVICNEASENEIKDLDSLSIKYYFYNIVNNRISILSDLIAIFRISQFIKIIKPNLVLAYYVKPMIYSGLITLIYKIKFIPLITGLTYVFYEGNFFRYIVRNILITFYKLFFNHAVAIIFQNKDDLKYFKNKKIAARREKIIIEGSGVNTHHFNYEPIMPLPVKFILVARMLYEKGIIEYLESARLIKQEYPQAEFQLVGGLDTSYDAIKYDVIKKYAKNDIVKYLGYQKNVKNLLKKSHIFVLPSYHEGMPRSVLEAMSIGRPIITNDVPGCRETVINNKNGFLVEKKNIAKLTQKMKWFIVNHNKINEMGLESRKIVLERFDDKIINTKFIEVFMRV